MFEVFDQTASSPRAIISIPHSGLEIPATFENCLTPEKRERDRDVDLGVPELIDIQRLNQKNCVVLVAKVHRICVDLNRPEKESIFNWKQNSFGKQLVLKEFNESSRLEFCKKYYCPYYTKLQELFKKHGPALPMIDLHSMPSRATDYHLKKNPKQKVDRPDFCISDFHSRSAPPDRAQFMKAQLESCGYQALVNDPYFGGNITQYFSQFCNQVIQLEIKRGLYMDENKGVLVPELVQKLKEKLTACILSYFAEFGQKTAP